MEKISIKAIWDWFKLILLIIFIGIFSVVVMLLSLLLKSDESYY